MTGRKLARMSDAGTDQLTIDELARRTRMTVRNIRAHQSRGLLPAPRRPRAHRVLRACARCSDRAHPRAPGRRLQARGDQPAARQRRRLERGGAALHPRGQGAVRRGAAAGRQRRGARRALLRRRRQGRRDAPPRREAGDHAPDRRRQLRGAEPAAGPSQRGAAIAGYPDRDGARHRPRAAKAVRRRRRNLRRPLHQADLEAVRGPGPTRERPAQGPRGARAPAPGRLRGLDGDVPAGDDRGGRAAHGRELERMQARDGSRRRR